KRTQTELTDTNGDGNSSFFVLTMGSEFRPTGLRLDDCANRRGDDGSKELDRAHDFVVRHWADGHLREKAVVVKELVLVENLVDHLLRAAHDESAVRRAGGVELLAGRRRPTAFAADT